MAIEDFNQVTIEPAKLRPFSRFIMSIGELPTSYLDSLSYAEQITWFCDYLQNNVIPAINNNAEALEEVQGLMTQLQEYVDNYFTNLDVQEEINNKIDSMVEDGTFSNLLAPYLESFNTRLDQFALNIQAETTARTTEDNSLQAQISTIVASAGTAGDSSSEIVAARTNIKSTTFTSLNDRINFIEKTVPFIYQVQNNADFNDYVTPGKYLLYGTLTNAPTGLSTTGVLVVEATSPSSNTAPVTYQYIIQRWYPFVTTYTNTGFAVRTIQRINDNPVTYNFRAWNIVNTTYINALYDGSKKWDRANLSDNFASNKVISTATDLNSLTNEGHYILTNDNNTNIPENTSILILDVESNLIANNSNNWIVQTARPTNNSAIYQRVNRVNTSVPGETIYGDWKKIYPVATTALYLTDKKIVNFGDSIIGNVRDSSSVSNKIADITNATVYNCGFGGCHMSDWSTYSTKWGAFSMTKLAYAIANNDWTAQETAIENENWSDKPAYFDDQLTALEAIDFSNIDYVTISYGTNDYAMGKTLDNANNQLDTTTICGALRYSIQTLQETFPNLRIIICTPILRLWNESGTIVTSDTKTFAGNFNLKQLVTKFKDIALEYHVPIVDAYNELGINEYCYTSFFTGDDLTHPNAYGRNQLARLYSNSLIK